MTLNFHNKDKNDVKIGQLFHLMMTESIKDVNALCIIQIIVNICIHVI